MCGGSGSAMRLGPMAGTRYSHVVRPSLSSKGSGCLNLISHPIAEPRMHISHKASYSVFRPQISCEGECVRQGLHRLAP